MNRSIVFSILLIVVNSCSKSNIKGEVYFNSSFIKGFDSSHIEISVGKDLLLDTIVLNSLVDNSFFIGAISLSETMGRDSVRIKVNHKDTLLFTPTLEKDFKMFISYDNITKLNEKFLVEIGKITSKDRDRTSIRDSLEGIYGLSMDTLKVLFKY